MFWFLLRYSLTEQGLSLAERLESVEQGMKAASDGGGERFHSGEAEEEERGEPGVVDLTCSDEDDDTKDRIE